MEQTDLQPFNLALGGWVFCRWQEDAEYHSAILLQLTGKMIQVCYAPYNPDVCEWIAHKIRGWQGRHQFEWTSLARLRVANKKPTLEKRIRLLLVKVTCSIAVGIFLCVLGSVLIKWISEQLGGAR